jgi:8-oxo-dGTP diphosphatase
LEGSGDVTTTRAERRDGAPGLVEPGRAPPLLYTICFCRRGDRVLLLYRNKPPNRHRWNGLGGRVEPGETPGACVRREVLEEAALDLRGARRPRFAGVVTWAVGDDPTSRSAGMYAYVADLGAGSPAWEGERPTREGLLGWKTLAWACDAANAAVAANLPHILPHMLGSAVPREHACVYQGERLIRVVVRPLAARLAMLGEAGEL